MLNDLEQTKNMQAALLEKAFHMLYELYAGRPIAEVALANQPLITDMLESFARTAGKLYFSKDSVTSALK
jgi:hypothetical protein